MYTYYFRDNAGKAQFVEHNQPLDLTGALGLLSVQSFIDVDIQNLVLVQITVPNELNSFKPIKTLFEVQ